MAIEITKCQRSSQQTIPNSGKTVCSNTNLLGFFFSQYTTYCFRSIFALNSKVSRKLVGVTNQKWINKKHEIIGAIKFYDNSVVSLNRIDFIPQWKKDFLKPNIQIEIWFKIKHVQTSNACSTENHWLLQLISTWETFPWLWCGHVKV